MTTSKNIYCIGLGGVGVSAVAKFWLRQGAAVSGSDPSHSPLIDDVINHGAKYFDTVEAAHINPSIDLVIYTDACAPDNVELVAAKKLGLVTQNFSEALGAIMANYPQRVAISGTNGKSTTTALTGLLLAASGLDPTVFVGSRVSSFDGNVRFGGADIFVAEADEYRDHFLNLSPTVLTITNVEYDHPDFFSSLDHVIQSFQAMVDRLPDDGKLVINIDDPIIRDHWLSDARVVTFGTDPRADLVISGIRAAVGQQTFTASWRGQSLGEYTLHVPGAFNVMNTAAAMATALTLGAKPTTWPQTISEFHGIWRRYEIVSTTPLTVINDYAHHPTAIIGTLAGTKQFFPGRRVVAIFQPHHANRLTALFHEFVNSFSDADEIIIAETYAVLGREQGLAGEKTGQDLVVALQNIGRSVSYAPDVPAVEAVVRPILQTDDVVVVMGAGDVWQAAIDLAKIP